MALPISGTLGINTIRASVGMLSTNVSLRQLTLVTAVGSNGATTKISNFYGWHGYGYYYPTVPFANYFDFALNGLYANSGSTISDLSGQGLNGTFVTGTGTGTATTIDQYTSTFPGYLTIPGDTPQKSVRLDNSMKMGGTSSYTVIVWVRVSSFTSSFPGVVAAEGRSGSNPIGWSMYLDNSGGYHINHTRWSGTSGTGQTTTITFGAGGVPAFAFDTWYMVTAIYDGVSTMGIYLHTGGTRYLTTVTNTYSLATDASWGAFLGLRYNNWLNGRIGYYAIYGSPLLSAWVDTVYESTRIRYGV
jgi:hypothetical protein